MDPVRKPFQGVWNIIRFNYHFYVLAGVVLVTLSFAAFRFGGEFSVWLLLAIVAAAGAMGVSLLVSWFVYDLSGLYTLRWLDAAPGKTATLLNINAGFDETSVLLREKYHPEKLLVFDFYDPQRHTEVSIKRARKAYPPYPGTQQVNTSKLPLETASVDRIIALLAAHEIRDEQERIGFFRELNRALHPSGQIIVTEHLRDTANFFAYTIGFFHFFSRASWLRTFRGAGLHVRSEKKVTPFITTFILEKNGAAT